MADPTKRYIDLAEAAERDVKRLGEAAEAELPEYSRQASKLSPDEQKQDYMIAKNTPGGFQLRLREWKEQYGLRRAAFMLLDWSRENERRG